MSRRGWWRSDANPDNEIRIQRRSLSHRLGMVIIMGFILAIMFFQFGNFANDAIAHLVFLTERYIFLRKTAYNEKYHRPCFLSDYLVT